MSQLAGWRHVVYVAAAVSALALGIWLARSVVQAPGLEAPPREGEAAWWLEDLDGRPRTTAEWAETTVLVNFWATWCAPCREEMPLLGRLREAYRARGLEVVGVAIDEPGAVRRFRDRLQIAYPLLVVRGDAAAMLRDWGSNAGALPYSVLRDGRGDTLATKTGPFSESELRRLLDQHLTR